MEATTVVTIVIAVLVLVIALVTIAVAWYVVYVHKTRMRTWLLARFSTKPTKAADVQTMVQPQFYRRFHEIGSDMEGSIISSSKLVFHSVDLSATAVDIEVKK